MKPYHETEKPIEQSLFSGSFAKKYGETGPVKLSNKTIVKTTSYSQTEIIQWIMGLYCPDGFELDPTYSVGNFYKNIVAPAYKFDLFPQVDGVVQADATNLPICSGSINSIMFDPPFVAAMPKKEATGLITKRFGYYKNIQHKLWDMYYKATKEFYRILKNKGVLVFKCQDVIDSSKQYMTHVQIMNDAVKVGFYPKDLFILIAKNRIVSQTTQQHARKFHSYFWVFIKQTNPVNYNINLSIHPGGERQGVMKECGAILVDGLCPYDLNDYEE